MKHILVNLKRFDIPPELGGVNRIAPAADWAATILDGVRPALERYATHDIIFFFPELHLIPALSARDNGRPAIGCQGVHDADTSVGGNFGAFTTQRTAHAMAAAGVDAALVGHSEERATLKALLERAGVTAGANGDAADREINARAKAAQLAGLRVVVCIGESADARDRWRQALTSQLEASLPGLDRTRLILAYEPLWAIGPGKTPPEPAQIREVAVLVKSLVPDVPLVYGGGLKAENAGAIAEITELDGGLIALTRFTGEIGFYPDEYLTIVDTYFSHLEATHAG